MPNDVTVDLGNAYIGSAYSPQVAITETEDGHEVTFTYADSENPGQLTTASYDVPTYASEEAEREAAEAARAAAESARAAAEQARTAAESARASAETGRATAEGEREDAETARAAAEQARASAETARAGAEASRASAEQARTSAESARASAEAGRAQAESARVSAEQARATAESARAAAESARVTAEQARQTDTAAAIARADAATTAANTATTDADAATTAAQAATGEAETATDAANAAAALATAAAETVTDAYFPDLTAGAAEGITGGGPTDTAAWTHRACPGTDGPATIESIHGRTVRWNQLMQNGNFASDSGWYTDYATVSVDGNVLSMSPSESGRTQYGLRSLNAVAAAQVVGHKYLVTLDANVSVACGINPIAYGTNGLTLIDTPNVWKRVSRIFTLPSVISNYTTRIYATLTSGTFDTTAVVKVRNFQLFDLTAMFGAGNEPSTVAEFEALYPLPYYPYDAGSLLSVQMDGIETVGFNQWDEQWESGLIDANGTPTANAQYIRSKNFIPVFPSTQYSATKPTAPTFYVCYYDADETFITRVYGGAGSTAYTFETPSNARYVKFATGGSTTPVTTYNHDICINLSWSGYRNGEYEPYWKSERTIPAATYFPNGMRSAGTVYDELTSDAAVTRVGAVDLGTLEWTMAETGKFRATENSILLWSTLVCTKYESYAGVLADMPDKSISATNSQTTLLLRVYDSAYTDAATFKAAMDGVMLHYALATPTTTPIDPPLNLTYRAAQGGTERILHTDPTAAPTLVVTYGSTADGIRDRALACIAHVENGLASANYAIGSYLIHGGQLCRVTTAIAAGETITIGTNVTATTVMAELLTLTQ